MIDQLVSLFSVYHIECSERAQTASTRDHMRILLAHGLQISQQIVARLLVELDQVVSLDGLENRLQIQHSDRVAQPRVEHSVRLHMHGLLVEVAADLHLLGEGDQIGRLVQVKVLVGPHLAGGAHTRLHLVDQKRDAVLLGNSLQILKEERTSVTIATLGLNRLHHNARHLALLHRVVVLDELLYLLQAILVLLVIVNRVLLERVAIAGKASHRPVERRYVHLVYGLGVSCGQNAQSSPVEAALEGQDAQVGTPGTLVHHTLIELVLSGRHSAAPNRVVVDEHDLVGVLVGTRTTGHRLQTSQTLRSYL